MKIRFRKAIVLGCLMALAVQISALNTAFAAATGDVVINEVAWMGSLDNSSDEWIELYNNSGATIDLSSWKIVDDETTVYEIMSGSIAAHGYFVIEDVQEASDVFSDSVIALSLANAGDKLELRNADDVVVDQVNANGEAWYAGSSETKASMERIDPSVSSDSADNFASAKFGNGAVGRNGSEILGTPGSANSNFGGSGPSVSISPDDLFAHIGDEVSFSVKIADAVDVYSYGLEIDYPELVLEFVSADEGNFLKADSASTAFNAALKEDGTLVVGNARMKNPADGIDGNGELFTMNFKVISTESASGELSFTANNFVADSVGDVPSKYVQAAIAIEDENSVVEMIAGLNASEGEARYSIRLDWQEDLDGASSYVVKRERHDGYFEYIGETADPEYVDSYDVVPGIDYKYQVLAVKNGTMSEAMEITAKEMRGIAGDNDRSDLVDGRDIERLARSFGAEYGDEEYSALKDSNHDGVINGLDLVEIGANFAEFYSE